VSHQSEAGIGGTAALGVSIPFLVSGIKETINHYKWEKEHGHN
jgi:hypothetical protein